MFSRKAGFTLLELLIVIAIIGILAAIILSALSTARQKAQVAAAQEQMHSLDLAMQIYYTGGTSISNEDYCSACQSDSGNPAIFTCSAAEWQDAVQPLIDQGILTESALKDPWGHPYCFDNNFFQCDATLPSVLFSMGPNGVRDTPWGPTDGPNWNQVFSSDDIGIILAQPTSPPSGPNLCGT